MLKPRLIPCLLLRDWGVEKSVLFADHVYVGSPINAVRVFAARRVDELILLDIAATPAGRGPDADVIAQIASEATMPMTVGGGIRAVEHIDQLLAAGADRVAINSGGLEIPGLVSQAAAMFGSQCVVASIDAKRVPGTAGEYEAMIRCGGVRSGLSAIEMAQRAEGEGAGEILMTSMDRDGTMTGYDLRLLEDVSAAVSIPVVAHGGAGSVRDFALALDHGAAAIAAGSFFLFYGPRRTVLITFPSDRELIDELGVDRVRRRFDQ